MSNLLPQNCDIIGDTTFVIEAYDIPDILISAYDEFICEGEDIVSSVIEIDDGLSQLVRLLFSESNKKEDHFRFFRIRDKEG